MLKLCMVGAMGRMGQTIIFEGMSNYKDKLEFVSGVDRKEGDMCGVKVYPSDKIADAVKDAQITINFTHADAEVKNVEAIAKEKKDMVIGTTGFSEEQEKAIEKAIKENGVSAVIAPNFSPLVNTQIFLAKKATEILAPLGYNIGIVEEHHTGKADSPSGTAKALAKAIIAGGGPQNINYWKDEKRKKEKDQLDMAVLRLGGTAGQHEVRIVGAHGRLVLETLMYNRSDFAKGALDAALWLAKNRGDGKIFGMGDILNLV